MSQTAIVTGGGSGLGYATAMLLAEQGVQVVVVDIDEGNGQKTVEDIKKKGVKAVFVKADVSKVEEVK